MEQATRLVKFGATTGSGGSLYSNATTWKQLVSEDTSLEAMSLTPGMAATIKVAGGATYKVTDSNQSLPTSEFNIYFTPDKNNSGTIEELEAELEKWAELAIPSPSNVEEPLPF